MPVAEPEPGRAAVEPGTGEHARPTEVPSSTRSWPASRPTRRPCRPGTWRRWTRGSPTTRGPCGSGSPRSSGVPRRYAAGAAPPPGSRAAGGSAETRGRRVGRRPGRGDDAVPLPGVGARSAARARPGCGPPTGWRIIHAHVSERPAAHDGRSAHRPGLPRSARGRRASLTNPAFISLVGPRPRSGAVRGTPTDVRDRARCSGCRSRSRTTSTSPGSPPPAAARR